MMKTDIANRCRIVGADIQMVRKGNRSGFRIETKFFNPGIGYGRSYFLKDVQALIKTVHENKYNLSGLEAVEAVSKDQKSVIFSKTVK